MNDNDENLVRNMGRELRDRLGLITEDELAAMLGLKSTATLATWRHACQGPMYVKLGKGVFYRMEDVHRWICNTAGVPCAA